MNKCPPMKKHTSKSYQTPSLPIVRQASSLMRPEETPLEKRKKEVTELLARHGFQPVNPLEHKPQGTRP